MQGLMAANYELRSRTQLDLGMLFFLPIHEGFGGRIRYLISGGSALPADVHEGLLRHGLQLLRGLRPDGDGAGADGDLAQGEAASPARSGEPLPGIEVKIAEPDAAAASAR